MLSSRDHPLMAAVDSFAGPVRQEPLQQIANEQCHCTAVCLSLGTVHISPSAALNAGLLLPESLQEAACSHSYGMSLLCQQNDRVSCGNRWMSAESLLPMRKAETAMPMSTGMQT